MQLAGTQPAPALHVTSGRRRRSPLVNDDFLCSALMFWPFFTSRGMAATAEELTGYEPRLRLGEGCETSPPGVVALNGPEKRCTDSLN